MNNITITPITDGSGIDPFSVFGADDDDDDDDVNNNDVRPTGTTIVPPTELTTTTINEKWSNIPQRNTGTGTSLQFDIKNNYATTPSIPIRSTENHDDADDDDDDNTDIHIPWPEQRTSTTNTTTTNNNSSRILRLYQSSQIRLVQSLVQFGGCRGYIATQTISPGTLLLIEQPIVSWSDRTNTTSHSHPPNENETLFYIFYHHILMNASLSSIQKQRILHDLEFFHPTKLVVEECLRHVPSEIEPTLSSDNNNHVTQHSSNISPDTIEQVYNMIQELRLKFGEHSHGDHHDSKENKNGNNYHLTPDTKLFQQIRDRLVDFSNSDTSPMTNDDIYRILLTLRYNALQSGLYYYSAMFNHSDVYNCVKFIPPTSSSNSGTKRTRHYSEIRTTRTVLKGEPLTISYIPNILSHASRRHYLWQQHRFDIGNTIPPEESVLYPMECIQNQFPILSNMNDYTDTVTYNIETAVSELEGMYHDIEQLLQQQEQHGIVNNDVDLFQQAQELEQASLELCISAEQELLQNPRHILLIPCRRLHVDICCMVQQHYEDQLLLSFVDRMKLLSRLVLSAYQLRYLQTMLYGSDHFDIARTNLDIVHGIEELLSRSPKHLLDLSKQFMNADDDTPCHGIATLQTISHWSTLEYTVRKDYERIKALYPDNSSAYIQQQNEHE